MQVQVPVTDRLVALRRTVEEARAMPMSASAVVNRTEVLGMLDDLEQAVGEAASECDRVLAQRDGIIGDAETRAAQIIEDARNERDRLLSDTEVYRVATREAETLLNDARAEAEGLRKETDDYVDSRLATFEITLERTIEAVRRGRERLAGRSSLDTWGGDDVDSIRLPAHLED